MKFVNRDVNPIICDYLLHQTTDLFKQNSFKGRFEKHQISQKLFTFLNN